MGAASDGWVELVSKPLSEFLPPRYPIPDTLCAPSTRVASSSIPLQIEYKSWIDFSVRPTKAKGLKLE